MKKKLVIASVDAWDKSVTETDYENWNQQVMGNIQLINLPFQDMTEENIAAVVK